MASIKPTKKEQADFKALAPSHESLSKALSLLRVGNDEDKAETKGKEISYTPKESPLVVQPTLLSVATSVFSPGKTYRIRTIRAATLVSSGGGTMALSTSIYPQNMSQYSALSALFTECRLHQTRIHLTFRSPTGGPVSLMVGFNPSSLGAVPSSVTQVAELPGARMFNTWNTVTTPMMKWVAKQPRPWSFTTASATGSDPVGGFAGSWQYSLVSAVSGAVNVADYLIECDYEFRNPV